MQRILLEWEDDDTEFEDDLPLSRFASPSYPSRGRQCDVCNFRYGHRREDCPLNPDTPQTVVCTFCDGSHPRGKCQKIKTNVCGACGLEGHFPSVCNKIKLGPGGQVGKCTYKKCKGKDAWGHFFVTCPRREAEQGPFQFKPGEDSRKARAPPRPLPFASKK